MRTDFIHTHGVVLQALARAGRALILEYPESWNKKIGSLRDIDWRRANSTMWEGRALVGSQLSKAHQNVVLTANAIKNHLGLELTADELRVEDAYKRGGVMASKKPKRKSAFSQAGFKKTIEALKEEIVDLYLSDEIPWVVGYSGGKDSTAVLQLI